MKKVFVALDGVAVGEMEIDESADLLAEIKKKYPDAKRAEPYEPDSIVIVVSTKDDDK